MAVAAIFAFPTMVPLASADGMTHVYDDVYDDWSLSAEETQYGLINHVDGYERMLLAIKVDRDTLESADQAVWIFTVPGDADLVSVDLMPAVSEIHGEPYSDLARRELCSNLLLGYGTQLYPAIMLPLTSLADPMLMSFGDSKGDWSNVDVASHVESRGMTVEVVSTQNADALEAYLLDLGLALDEQSYSLVSGYVGEDYSFIVSWISDVEQFRSEVPVQYDGDSGGYYYELGLFARFPTDRVFYPLKLTSVYGDATVPMLLQVLGFVEPDDDAADYGPLRMDIAHKVAEHYHVSPQLSPFFTASGDTWGDYTYIYDVEYTEVVITARSDLLEEDLWMVPASSATLGLQSWVLDNGLMAAVLVVAGLSSMSGVVAGALVFAPHRPVLWKFAILGLANALTVVGLWFVAAKMEVERTMTRSEVPVPAKPYRLDFLVVYSFVFVVSISVVLMAFWV